MAMGTIVFAVQCSVQWQMSIVDAETLRCLKTHVQLIYVLFCKRFLYCYQRILVKGIRPKRSKFMAVVYI